MTPEKKRKIAKVLSLVVTAGGILVIIGWIFDIGVLKSIIPAWVSMKFDTALSFILSGITLYFIARAVEGEFDKAQVVLSITSLIIILLMGLLLFSEILKINTGLEQLFVKDSVSSPMTVVPGRPSMLTMLNFVLIALAGILTTLSPHKSLSGLKFIGLIVAAIGAVAVIGYIINNPHMYYYVAGINSAIAFHTAVLFILLGFGLICLSD